MKTVIALVVLIIAAAVVYTGYSVLSFEPQKPAPLVFNEPSPETLKSLGIYEEASVPAVPLTPAQQQQTSQALNKIAAAMTIYQGYTELAEPQFKTTLSLLNSAIAAGRLPAYFLTVTGGANTTRSFQTLTFDPANLLAVKPADKAADKSSDKSSDSGSTAENGAPQVPAQSPVQTSVACSSGPTGSTDILIGDENDNILTCGIADDLKGHDQVFLGGPGNDTITDNSGNRIINPGTGNDTIKIGPGRSIIVLEDGWGRDTIEADCSGARVTPDQIPQGFPVPWVAENTNFIVLSPRISAASVAWAGNVLKSTNGDTLTINDNCFTLISASPE